LLQAVKNLVTVVPVQFGDTDKLHLNAITEILLLIIIIIRQTRPVVVVAATVVPLQVVASLT